MKRVFCCFLVTIIILINCGISSLAAEVDKGIPIPYTLSDSIEYDSVDLPTLSDNAPVYYYEFEKGKTVYSSYSLLDDCQKKMFDYIVNAPAGTLTISMTFEYGEFLYSNFVSEYLWEVMYAVCNDRPDIFYYNGYSIDNGYLYDNTCVKSLDYTISIYKKTTYNDSNIAAYHANMLEAMKAVPVDLTNRYLFVSSVHDYLCNSIYYPDLNSADYIGNSHDAYGALVEGRAVCQGYAEAFKLICDYYKIPSVCITGTANGGAHMWNAVQMDDGLWYLLDITWDDQTEKATAQIYYDFFLIGLNTKDIYFGGEVFSDSHVSDTDLFLPILNYATEKYTQTDHFTEFQATYNSIVKSTDKYLIRSFYDAKDSYVYYDGMYVEVTTPATNSKISVPSGTEGTKEDWTLILIGDCNGDGSSDVADYSDAVNKVLAGTDVSTVYDIASDASCDGYLDVIDLAILERAINGRNTNIILE